MRRAAVGLFQQNKAKVVAVGQSGNILTSNDAINWAVSTPSQFSGVNINDVVWAAELGLYVAVGDTAVICTSPDGYNWTYQSGGFGASSVLGVTWAASLGLLVAVGTNGKISTSPDGVNWTQRTSPTSQVLRKVAWSSALGLFTAVGDTTTSQGVITSSDGITWTLRSSTINGTTSIMDVALKASPNIVVIVSNNSQVSWASNPTSTWTAGTSPFTAARGLAYGSTRFVMVGDSNNAAYSADGSSWSSTNPQFGANSVQNVSWIPGLSLFVAVGQGGKISTSPDGITWTARTTSFASYILSVAGM